MEERRRPWFNFLVQAEVPLKTMMTLLSSVFAVFALILLFKALTADLPDRASPIELIMDFAPPIIMLVFAFTTFVVGLSYDFRISVQKSILEGSLEQIKAKNYQGLRVLRPGDELKSLSDASNELAAQLEKGDN